MNRSGPRTVTMLLDLGDAAALSEVWSMLHAELKRLARAKMAGERAGHVLQSTALLNEAYLRLYGRAMPSFENRHHFFAAAAKAMTRILCDIAQAENSAKRGGDRQRVPLDVAGMGCSLDPAHRLAIRDALRQLESINRRRAEVVRLRFYSGLTVDETAAVLGVSEKTIDSDWRVAKAWLYAELSKGASSE